jgi:hypothetical protein
LRIDWGYFVLAIPSQDALSTCIASDKACRDGFVASGKLPGADDTQMPRPANKDWPVLASAWDLGSVGRDPVERWLMVAYDDLYSVEYLGRRLKAYWTADGGEFDNQITRATAEYRNLVKECDRFNKELMSDLQSRGGTQFAQTAALAFRQCLAAHKLVIGHQGRPLYFPKENFSNGCIGTVDVIYPSSPFFLLFNPALLRAQMVPLMDYAQSDRWKFPFAPHDLGTYPLANGQVYGGGELTEKDQMPVEESGNMLLMAAALVKTERYETFASTYWPLLSGWAGYLLNHGLDPENQLCTDDFAGHLAHNANLSLKAILAIASGAQIADRMDQKLQGEAMRQQARRMAQEWAVKASDQGHFRLAFDKPGSWSLKYNLVWDRLLDLKMFPPDVARLEVAFYKQKLNPYGVPLDNRKSYTKADWLIWAATLAESRKDFESLANPVYRFLNETPDRVPFSDWYDTMTAKKEGFQARTVVGGVYLPMLSDAGLWKKWSKRAEAAGR